MGRGPLRSALFGRDVLEDGLGKLPQDAARPGIAALLRFRSSIVFQSAAWLALAFVYHSVLRGWLAATHERLGWIDASNLVPLQAVWAAQTPGPWAIPALLVLLLLYAARKHLFLTDGLPPAAFVALASALFVVVAASVAMIDGYVDAGGRHIPAFLVQHTLPHYETYGDVPQLEREGLRAFSASYAMPSELKKLANHTRSHPPGAVLFQWVAVRLFGRGEFTPPLAELLFGALLVPIVYLLGRDLYGERPARLAVALTIVAPNVVMFATSMDAPFAVFLLLAGWLLIRAVRRGSVGTAIAAGLAMAAAAFMTFTTAILIGLLGLWFVSEWRSHPERAGRMLGVVAVGAVTCWIAYASIAVATGYPAIAAFRTQQAFNTAFNLRGREAGLGRYLNTSFANLMAFLIGTGAPIVCLSRAMAVDVWRKRQPADSLVMALALGVPLAAFSSIYSLEVERIWLFITPLLALVAGRALTPDEPGAPSVHQAMGLACALLFITECAIDTAW
jgi:Dolichyl-phosphate-mannose-protein mannosyltransferase